MSNRLQRWIERGIRDGEITRDDARQALHLPRFTEITRFGSRESEFICPSGHRISRHPELGEQLLSCGCPVAIATAQAFRDAGLEVPL